MKNLSKKSIWVIFPLFVIIILTLIVVYCLHSNHNKMDETTDNFYPTNKNGQTYGSAMYADAHGYPDLILAVGDDGTEGYVTQVDFWGRNKDEYEHYEKAITNEALLEHYRKQYKDEDSNYKELDFYQICYDIPLYDETGEVIIGKVIRTIETLPYE